MHGYDFHAVSEMDLAIRARLQFVSTFSMYVNIAMAQQNIVLFTSKHSLDRFMSIVSATVESEREAQSHCNL